MNKLDLNKTVYELCKEYPELPQILADLGFQDITKPGMITTVGRFMTIPKGAKMKKIDLTSIIQTLTERGFQVDYNEPEV
jgi:hypothetical protein